MHKEVKYQNEFENDNFDYKDHLVSATETNQEMEDFLTGKIPQGFTCGIHAMDKYFCLKKNEFYICTGKKGQGKTTINQAIHILYNIKNNLLWVVAYQENSYWSMKLNYMNYILGEFANEVRKRDPLKYNLASEWIDKRFIFINVESIKQALDTTKELIKSGKDIHAVFLDPINSFRSGYQDTGNGYADGIVTAMEVLKFTKEYCSVHISQHPTMSGQRQEGAVTSYQAEGGWYLNKASFTYVIDRQRGSSENSIIVENVRNKHTGGSETNPESQLIIDWKACTIDIFQIADANEPTINAIQELVQKYNPLGIEDKTKEITATTDEAFGTEYEKLSNLNGNEFNWNNI